MFSSNQFDYDAYISLGLASHEVGFKLEQALKKLFHHGVEELKFNYFSLEVRRPSLSDFSLNLLVVFLSLLVAFFTRPFICFRLLAFTARRDSSK